MDQVILLKVTNAILGLAILALVGMVLVAVVRELLERRKPNHPKTMLFEVPSPAGPGLFSSHHPSLNFPRPKFRTGTHQDPYRKS